MALNSSGPLSFGGSTVGQSINLELGVSATALASIDSTAFRTLAGVASGQISVSNFYGKSNAVKQWALVANSPSDVQNNNVLYDSSGNQYQTMNYFVQPWRFGVQKWNASNVLQFSSLYVGSVTNTYGNTIGGQSFFDASSGDLYFNATAAQGGSPYRYPCVTTKVTSSGAGGWSVSFNITDGTYNYGSQVAAYAIAPGPTYTYQLAQGSGSQIVGYDCCGPITSTTFFYLVIKMASSNGAVQWQYRYTGPLGSGTCIPSIGVQSGNDLYVSVVLGGSLYGVMKLADGIPSVAKYYGFGALNNSQPNVSPVLDSAGNFIDVNVQSSGSSFWQVVKLNTSLDLTFQKGIVPVNVQGGSAFVAGLAVDSSNNIYVMGTYADSSNGVYSTLLVKFNSAGTTQWSARIQAQPSTAAYYFDCRGKGISITGTSINIGFSTASWNGSSTPSVIATVIMPTDGSSIGTTTTVPYPGTSSNGTRFTITSSSPTISTGSYSSTAWTPSRSTYNTVVSNGSVVTGTLTPTRSVANI
jgi:hypothetical protein